MDGTVNDANLDVLAFDCAGAAGDKSLISVGAIFDAMTMGCFKFDSSLGGLDAALDFSIALTGSTGLAGLAAFLTGASTTLTDFALTAGFAIGLIFFCATALGAGFWADLTTGLEVLSAGFVTGLLAVLATALTTALPTTFGAGLEAGFETALTGLTTFFAATLVTTLAAALLGTLTGAFLTAFFATVFIHCLPAELVFIQIKQSTHTHQKTNAFTLKLLRIYLPHLVINKYSNIAKIQSARGL